MTPDGFSTVFQSVLTYLLMCSSPHPPCQLQVHRDPAIVVIILSGLQALKKPYCNKGHYLVGCSESSLNQLRDQYFSSSVSTFSADGELLLMGNYVNNSQAENITWKIPEVNHSTDKF